MRWLWRLCFWLALVAVSIGSLLPPTQLPPQAFDVWDKAQHAGGFAVLTLLCLPAFAASRLRVFMWLAIYGVLIEVAQQVSGWRTGDPMDWMADVAGVLAGLVLHWTASKFRHRTTTDLPDAQ